jgi:phosphate:Na+ symporter
MFLLGMILMTDGIQSFAGDTLRRSLLRLTGNPIRAFLSGVLITVIVQSSSATTVTVIGFVSAGLMTFTQSVSVVIGASLGTTGTGWLVSVLGLKFSLGAYAMPLVAGGALLRLLGRGRWREVGLPIAGFGLIFIGIETLQGGMRGVADDFDIAGWSSTGLFAHFVMMLVGIALTVVTQSSSAAMATILTALHTGSISFEQAASLVIGSAIGTTVTSVLASIGASVSAKRTAAAHVLFNLATGTIAVVTLPMFLRLIRWMQETLDIPPGAISLAAFHTAFIGMGVIIFMPMIGPFSRLIERWLPDTEMPLTRHLDESVLAVPEVALEATRRALAETAAELFDAARRRITSGKNNGFKDSELPRVAAAIDRIQPFLARIHHLPTDRPMSRSHVAQIHAIDHLLRLEDSLKPPRAQIGGLIDPRVKETIGRTDAILALAGEGMRGTAEGDWVETIKHSSAELAEIRRRDRPKVMQATAFGGWAPEQALILLDTMRWLDRIGYHTWRISHYLNPDLNSVELAEDVLRMGDDAIDEPSPETNRK